MIHVGGQPTETARRPSLSIFLILFGYLFYRRRTILWWIWIDIKRGARLTGSRIHGIPAPSLFDTRQIIFWLTVRTFSISLSSFPFFFPPLSLIHTRIHLQRYWYPFWNVPVHMLNQHSPAFHVWAHRFYRLKESYFIISNVINTVVRAKVRAKNLKPNNKE